MKLKGKSLETGCRGVQEKRKWIREGKNMGNGKTERARECKKRRGESTFEKGTKL